MAPSDTVRRFLSTRAGLWLTVVLVAGCGPQESWTVPGLPPDTLTAALEDTTAAAEGVGEALAARQAERRAMVAVDSLFPHSIHRDVSCQRCHGRPPGHATHDTVQCRACHGRPAGFASLAVTPPRECATCHHVRQAPVRGCRACHNEDQVGPRPVLVAIKAVGAAEPRVRTLDFDHENHVSRECRTCHTTPVTLQFGLECKSCHEFHHTQDARCMTCHVDVNTPVHTNTVHSGCAGSQCHGNAPVLSLTPTRNVCEVCHQDRVDHRPGRECTECHIGFGASLRERGGGGR